MENNKATLRRVRFLFFTAVALFSITSCDTDVEVLAPYDSKPVIYGVLSASADTQWFRINRTFLGSGNFNDYAQQKDSVEYDPSEIVGKVYKIALDGDTAAIFNMSNTTIAMRDSGAFYTHDVQAWYFTDPLLEDNEDGADFDFLLDIAINGAHYKSQTKVLTLSFFDLLAPDSQLENRLSLTFNNNENYRQIPIKVNNLSDADKYEVNVIYPFHYSTSDGIVDSTSYTYTVGTANSANLSSNAELTFQWKVENFYEFIGDKLDEIPGLASVQMSALRFDITAADKPLSTYIDVNNPVRQTFSRAPGYGNIDGALGIFGSRYTLSFSKWINENSIAKFNSGDYTNQYCFCVDYESAEHTCASPTGCN